MTAMGDVHRRGIGVTINRDDFHTQTLTLQRHLFTQFT